jgi:hypothetical protein
MPMLIIIITAAAAVVIITTLFLKIFTVACNRNSDSNTVQYCDKLCISPAH